MRCRHCDTDVPAGAFCGSCGAQVSAPSGHRRGWLRLGAYAAAPAEHVLRLAVASSIFPRLPHRSRNPFRFALAGLVVVLVAVALLRWQAPLMAVSAFGIPILFLIYLHESDVYADLPRRSLLLTGALGVGLGAGWAVLTGRVVARAYDVALGGGTAHGQTMIAGLAIPLGGAALMLVPAAAVRALRQPARESLDGFVIGSFGAIVFTAALTVTLLAPQFRAGLVAHDRPASGLLAEAGIRGVAMPLTAAALGGIFGAALWFTPGAGRPSRPAVLRIAVAVAVMLAVYAVVGLIDVDALPDELHLGLHLFGTLLAVLALRMWLQAALLHEAHDEQYPGETLWCPNCEHVVADMAFCPHCGVASAASSRSSRTARRRPHAAGTSQAPLRTTSAGRLLVTFGAGLTVAIAAVVSITAAVTPSTPRYVCPPDCGRPPLGEPVEANPRFTSSSGDFSVSYPGNGTAYRATTSPTGIVLEFLAGDTGILALFGEAARDRTPRQIADELIKRSYPDAVSDYEIPNALVGYQPGYGVVADDYPQDSSGSYARMRILVVVAVKNGLALVASAVGPYHEFSPDFGTGHPSGANLQLAMDMAKYVNSFTWRGDPPR
ncbi:MAG: zinc ribbon domain-containing protein [Mycobacteriaceae bacterium]|nr:zinc ribbon domain-containing protein [Mycobacteriaceae bacterium]